MERAKINLVYKHSDFNLFDALAIHDPQTEGGLSPDIVIESLSK